MSNATPPASYWRRLEAKEAHQLSVEEDDPDVVHCSCGEIFWANSDHVSPNQEIIRAFNHGFSLGVATA